MNRATSAETVDKKDVPDVRQTRRVSRLLATIGEREGIDDARSKTLRTTLMNNAGNNAKNNPGWTRG